MFAHSILTCAQSIVSLLGKYAYMCLEYCVLARTTCVRVLGLAGLGEQSLHRPLIDVMVYFFFRV